MRFSRYTNCSKKKVLSRLILLLLYNSQSKQKKNKIRMPSPNHKIYMLLKKHHKRKTLQQRVKPRKNKLIHSNKRKEEAEADTMAKMRKDKGSQDKEESGEAEETSKTGRDKVTDKAKESMQNEDSTTRRNTKKRIQTQKQPTTKKAQVPLNRHPSQDNLSEKRSDN